MVEFNPDGSIKLPEGMVWTIREEMEIKAIDFAKERKKKILARWNKLRKERRLRK